MKKLFILLLAVALAACSTPAPAPTEAAAPPPAEPVVVTVVVEPTQAPAEPAPTQAPAEPVVVTVVVEPTQAPVQAAPAPTEPPPVQPTAPAGDAPIALDVALGRGVFSSMTMSSNSFTLRCFPRDVTFNITTPNLDIRDVEFWYRVVDLKRVNFTEWRNSGKMTANGNGNFTVTFTGEDIHPDLRIDGSWVDFQFIGLAKSGNVVDRSDKIESVLKYTFDCP